MKALLSASILAALLVTLLPAPAAAQDKEVKIQPGAYMVRLDFIEPDTGFVYYPPADALPSFTVEPAGVGEVVRLEAGFWLRVRAGERGQVVTITARFSDGTIARGGFPIGSLSSGRVIVGDPDGPPVGRPGTVAGKWKLDTLTSKLPFGPDPISQGLGAPAFDTRHNKSYLRRLRAEIRQQGDSFSLVGRAQMHAALQVLKSTSIEQKWRIDHARGHLYVLNFTATGRQGPDGRVLFKGTVTGVDHLFELYYFSDGDTQRAHKSSQLSRTFEVTLYPFGKDEMRGVWQGQTLRFFRKGSDKYDDVPNEDLDEDSWEYDLFVGPEDDEDD